MPDRDVIVCGGQEWDPYGKALGPPCGTRYKGGVEAARAAGWAIGPGGAMCAACRKPDPSLAKGLTP